jgi:hypothetical protein
VELAEVILQGEAFLTKGQKRKAVVADGEDEDAPEGRVAG